MHPTRIFKSPDELEHAWNLYKQDLQVQALEWVKIQYVGKEAQRMEDPFKLPYTMEGFSVFCYKNYGVIKHYFQNTDGYYDDFCPICLHIKEEIRSNQITGGMLGVFNPSITQRLNSLVEKTEDVSQPKTPTSINITVVQSTDDDE